MCAALCSTRCAPCWQLSKGHNPRVRAYFCSRTCLLTGWPAHASLCLQFEEAGTEPEADQAQAQPDGATALP